MRLATVKFWIWIWCKVNWKFLIGFGIPIILGIIFRKNKQVNILKKGLEFRKNQLEVEQIAAGIKDVEQKKAFKDFVDQNEKIENSLEDALNEIESKKIESLANLTSAEKVTEEINKRIKD